MKSLVFSLDILLGIGLFLSLISLIPITYEPEFEFNELEILSLEANDLLRAISEVKIIKYKNTPTISQLYEQGVINEKDLNSTVLEFIGNLWFSGNKTLASNVTKEILGNLTSRCFSLETENETIYSNCPPTNGSKVVAYQISSGYEIGKPVFGYIARAWATKVVKNTSKIIPFYPEGSGWKGRKLEVTKRFKLPENITIFNATLYVSVHFGTSQSQAQFEELKVNGIEKKDDITWLYLQEARAGWEITTAAYGVVDVTDEIKAGNNTIYLSIKTPNYHSHIHPGMRLIVTYNLTQTMEAGNRSFTKRFYFDDVVGRTGAWSMVSFYIPENAENVSATLHLNLKNVEDTRVFWQNTTDVQIYVNSEEPVYRDSSSSLCYFVSSYYCWRTIVSTKNLTLDLDITPYLINGTNVVSVYANCYGDLHWGSDEAIIYSNPLEDPEDSSWVEVHYELPKKQFEYGEIDLTKEILFGGEASNPKLFNYSISEAESKIIEAFVHIAQGFSSMIEVYQWWDDENETLIFTSPSVRVVPENVYVYPAKIKAGLNWLKLVDVQPSGSVSSTNYILPWSSFEYTYLVKGLVGYGEVFNSSQLAIQDAIERLKEQMGNEGIGVESLNYDSQAVQGIQWLWGPALFKLVMWK